MPKKLPEELPAQILAELARYPEGAGMDELHAVLGEVASRRSLQRRVAELLGRQQVAAEGEGRATRYRVSLIHFTGKVAFKLSARATAEVYVPISPEGEEIKAYVRQPVQIRQPVGYEPKFLEAYRPNETSYLPEALRAQLHSLGRSPAEQSAAGTFARDILNRLLIDLSWASSRLEGNTYTRLDTERLIEHGQVAEGKDALETQMILNHQAAIEYLVSEVNPVGVDTATMLALHALLSDGLLRDPQAGGRVRNRAVEIGGSVYLPVALPQRLEELFGIVLDMAAEIRDPFEQALFLMVHLPYLQPFVDVNKRVSRLAANIPLIRHNLCPLSFIDVSEQAYVDAILGVYELNRIELLRDVFVSAYARSCQQYVAVRQQLIPPDTFRLRYRAELAEAMQAIVRSGQAASAAAIRAATPVKVAEDDRERFFTVVEEEFKTLHEGNAIRFGLRPLEFAEWKRAIDEAKKPQEKSS